MFQESQKKYFEKEIENYLLFSHPFIPKYYGFIEISNFKSIILEFIKGNPLLKIQELNLNEKVKIDIIFQLMIILQYIHSKNKIYRDLKPDNIMINDDKIAVLIDFGSTIDEESYCVTRDFVPDYSSPELNHSQNDTSDITCKTDIYSLGMIIYFILTESRPRFDKNKKLSFDNFPEKYFKMKEMIIECTNPDPNERPTLFSMMKNLYFSYLTTFEPTENGKFIVEILEKDFEICQYNPEFNSLLGQLYYDGKYIDQDISKGLKYFSKGADSNDAESIILLKLHYVNIVLILYERMKFFLFLKGYYCIINYQLGDYYYFIKSYDKSIAYCMKSADYDYVPAHIFLGMAYHEGKIVAKNISKAIYHFKIAAENGDEDIPHILGNIYFDEIRDFQEAIKYYQISAMNGKALDQEILGLIYASGIYTPKDIRKAIYYFTLANKNNPSPKYDYYIGMAYIKNIPDEIEKGFKYLNNAANSFYPEALFQLGYFYKIGKHIKKDIRKTIHYWEIASAKNSAEAMYFLGEYYYEGFPPLDIQKAVHYLKLAANRNYFPAHNMLSEIYINGNWTGQNIAFAIKCLEIAANNHCKNAQFALGYLYYEGTKVRRDFGKAIHYYKMDSNLNSEYAQNNLGVIYKSGIGVDKNINNAKEYFIKAIKKGNFVSSYNLAHIYFYGEGINVDYDETIKLLIESRSNFDFILLLLCLVIIKKYGLIDNDVIKKEYQNYNCDYNPNVYQKFLSYKISQEEFYMIFYDKLKNMSLIHTLMHKFLLSNEDLLNNIKEDYFSDIQKQKQKSDINKEFYEGFDLDI